MTPLLWLVVGLAGAGGALLRHEVTTRATDALSALHAINVVGAGALGLVLGAFPGSAVALAAAAGGLGAVTSFSTWMVQSRGRGHLRHLVLPLLGAVLAALAGTLLGRALGATP